MVILDVFIVPSLICLKKFVGPENGQLSSADCMLTSPWRFTEC